MFLVGRHRFGVPLKEWSKSNALFQLESMKMSRACRRRNVRIIRPYSPPEFGQLRSRGRPDPQAGAGPNNFCLFQPNLCREPPRPDKGLSRGRFQDLVAMTVVRGIGWMHWENSPGRGREGVAWRSAEHLRRRNGVSPETQGRRKAYDGPSTLARLSFTGAASSNALLRAWNEHRPPFPSLRCGLTDPRSTFVEGFSKLSYLLPEWRLPC